MKKRVILIAFALIASCISPAFAANSKVTNSVVWWGDSLTAGAGGAGISAPSELSKILKIPVLNKGVGGENSSQIAVRSGAREISIKFWGDGKKDGDWRVFQVAPSAEILRQGSNVLAGSIQGCVAILKFEGSSYSARVFKCKKNLKNGNFKFSIIGLETMNSKYKVIWSGRNNGGDSATVLSDVSSMIDFFKNANPNVKIYVLSVINGAGEGRGTGAYTGIDGVNTALSSVDATYIDVRKCLINQGLKFNKLTATLQDTLDLENDLVPAQLRSDNIHLNSFGYRAVAVCVANVMKSA